MKRQPYLTMSRLAQMAAALSERDRALLNDLRTLRLATSSQLVRVHLVDLVPRRQRAVLASLTERGLVTRLPRAIGGVRAGSAGHVYRLGPAAYRLLADPSARRRPAPQYGSLFLAHSLAVTEVYVQLREAERAGRLVLVRFTGEPATWRTFPGSGGGRAVLKPDAGAVVQLGSYQDSWFLEIDMDTESTTTIARACDRYRSYWQTGREQAGGGVFPKVLWLVPDQHRYDQLVSVLAKQPPTAWKLFAVALQSDAVDRMAEGVTA